LSHYKSWPTIDGHQSGRIPFVVTLVCRWVSRSEGWLRGIGWIAYGKRHQLQGKRGINRAM